MTHQSPAERLQRALDEYWPDGSIHFRIINGNMWFYIEDFAVWIIGELGRQWVATIAAVASECRNGWTLELSRASNTFQKIYEAATEAEQ